MEKGASVDAARPARSQAKLSKSGYLNTITAYGHGFGYQSHHTFDR